MAPKSGGAKAPSAHPSHGPCGNYFTSIWHVDLSLSIKRRRVGIKLLALPWQRSAYNENVIDKFELFAIIAPEHNISFTKSVNRALTKAVLSHFETFKKLKPINMNTFSKYSGYSIPQKLEIFLSLLG